MQEQNRHIFKIGHVSHNQVVQRWIAVASVILVLAGCAAPVVEEDPRIKALTTRLNEIETVRLKDQSTSEPVSVEQATIEINEQITEPNESCPVVELTLAEVRAAAIANNLDLKVELVDPSIAQQAVDEQRAKFESVFFGSARHRSTEAVDSATVSKTNSYKAGVESPLYTGGSIIARFPFSDAETENPDFDGVSEAAVSVSFIQSLLRDAGTRVNTQRRILSEAQGVTAAYRYYKVEQSQFQLGLRTSTDVLLAAASLADAQSRKIRAFVEYQIAQVYLARATGTLLGYGHIQLEPINIENK